MLPILLAERFSIRPDEVILSTVSYLSTHFHFERRPDQTIDA